MTAVASSGMSLTTPRRPAFIVPAEIQGVEREIAACAVAKYATSAARRAARAELDAQLGGLLAELVPDGIDPRFVRPGVVGGLTDEVVMDLLAPRGGLHGPQIG